MAVNFNANVNLLNLLLDGQRISWLTLPARSSVGNGLPLQIGRNGPASGKYWQGKIADVRIWNVFRFGNDIAADYRIWLNGPRPGLVANWHFDEGSGTSASESSGNHHVWRWRTCRERCVAVVSEEWQRE